MKLNILNMYPDILNLYGDLGNLLSIKQRCLWRDISVEIENFSIDNEPPIEETDVILVGGGSDNSQKIVSNHLLKHRKIISDFIEEGKPVLAICGSYQMFGSSYLDSSHEEIPCLEIFEVESIGEEGRLIGNIVIENNLNLAPKELIGFENHGGRTFHNYEPLGHVIIGNGNNGEDKTEGMIYKNFIGSYLHGPLLPKNPHLADHLILEGLKPKYDINKLNELDDTIELNAHNAINKKLIKNSK